MRINSSYWLTFDDVQLKPCYSDIPSRFSDKVDLSTDIIPGIKLQYPIISANMDTVTHWKMVEAMGKAGCLGIMHRFQTEEQHRVGLINAATRPAVACIGIGKVGQHRLEEIYDLVDAVLIDVAHGHCKAVIQQIKWCKKKYPKLPIIAGNVATAEGAEDLIKAGAKCIKVGVGPGSLCTTRIQTGCGVPQLSAIIQVADKVHEMKKKATIIADGGIKSSGDIVKALAAGAHAVMIGNLLAGSEETPGELLSGPNGTLYKRYRGMASREAQEDWKGSAQSVEGESTDVPYKGSILGKKGIISRLTAGIRSGMTYVNAKSIQELQKNAQFVVQTQAGYNESRPHGLGR